MLGWVKLPNGARTASLGHGLRGPGHLGQDRWAAAGRRIACPLLFLWAAKDDLEDLYDPLAIWRDWADDVRGQSIDCRLPPGPWFLTAVSAVVSGIKRDSRVRWARHFPPVLVVLRSQSRWRGGHVHSAGHPRT
jgi:hypothetical protein